MTGAAAAAAAPRSDLTQLDQSDSRPQSPSFLVHVVGKLQIKPSGSGDENGPIITLLCCKDRARMAASDWLAKYTHNLST